MRTHRSAMASVLVSVLAAAAVLWGSGLTATVAAATTPRAVRVGVSPRVPPGATALGALPGPAALEATVTLNPSDAVALAAYATAVSTPGNGRYGQYLTSAQFAAQFGPS